MNNTAVAFEFIAPGCADDCLVRGRWLFYNAAMRDTYDYIIVGAGSAGCVLAARLSEVAAHTVLLVESGPRDDSPFIHMPMGMGVLMKPGNPHYWEYAVAQGRDRGEEKWVKGRTLGGSSSINGMVYVRGAPADYDAWQAAGCSGWGWEAMRRCFVALEDHELGASASRGVGGPLRISMPPMNDPLGDAVLAAAAQVGIPTVVDVNDERVVQTSCFGYQPRTIWRGRRFSAATAFLSAAKGRANLDIITDSEVVGIEFKGTRVTGVRVRQRDRERIVAASAEVILAAGAINSPTLLQLSGIGPAHLLAGLGIDVRVDAPEVGQGLREHRGMQISYRLTKGGHNAQLRRLGLIRSAARYLWSQSGALANSAFDLNGFVKTAPDLERADGQIGVGLYSFAQDDAEDHHPFSGKRISAEPGMTLYGCFMRPESRGEVRIKSADPRMPPYISANYMAEEIDRVRSIALFRLMRTIASQPALQPFIAGESMPGAKIASDEDILDATFRYGTPGYHVAGTCRMGGDARSVLDPQLRVRGVQGLRVVDTSIMPSMVSGNTNAPAMAIAWRASDFILAGAQRTQSVAVA